MTLPISALQPTVDLSNTIILVKNKVYNIGKETFKYLARHQYALSASVWTFLVIQVGVNASSIFAIDAIDDLETCRENFHAYLNISHSNSISSGFYPVKGTKEDPFSSLDECIFYLRKLHSWYLPYIWNTICPSKKLVMKAEKLNKFTAQCFDRMCSENKAISLVNKNMKEWCSLTKIKSLKQTLKSLTKNSMLPKSDEWTIEDMLQLSVDLLIEVIKKSESVLASILSAEIVQKKTLVVNFDLIKKGTQEIISLSLQIIKSLLGDDLAKEFPEELHESMWKIIENIDESLPYQ